MSVHVCGQIPPAQAVRPGFAWGIQRPVLGESPSP